MRIQHNIAALNSYRQLGGNNNAVSKNLEKLSSGYRINRAGDDAAGLAISEKMRAQIKGLETAQKNANDGISLVQTAEGALTEVHSMLNRMVELATQSANGTYDNETDRANLQKEVVSLKSEIDRIAESTNYNGIKLLDGSLGVTSGGEVVSGGKVAYADGLTTETIAATADQFEFASNATAIGGSGIPAAGNQVVVEYKDADGKIQKRTLTGDGNTSIDKLINNDEVLGKLFTAATGTGSVNSGGNGITSGTIGIVSKVAGQDAPKIESLTGLDQSGNMTAIGKASTSVAGTDASTAFKVPTGETTFTIGDQTFQIVTAGGVAAKGNNEIRMAAGNSNATVTEVVDALKKAGITSAAAVATAAGAAATTFKITDEKQMQVDAKGVAVSVDSNAGAILASKAEKNVFKLDDRAGSGNQETLKLDFIDKDGNAQKIEVKYSSVKSTSPGNTSADKKAAQANTQAILNALSGNADFNKHFEIDSATNEIKSKTAGADAAKLSTFTTSDTTTATATGSTATQGITFTRTQEAQDAEKKLTMTEITAGTTITVNGKTYEFVEDGKDPKDSKNTAVTRGATLNDSVKNLSSALSADGIEATYDGTNSITFSNSGSTIGGEGKGLVLQVGDTSEDYQKVTVQVGNMSVKSLGLDGVDISTQEKASASLDAIRAAINKVSSTRGDLGAIQNRLDHTINNLGVATENMTAAESRIRDTDMASEMMTFTKNNILTQAAQTMLAQANQLPQGVLQLLQ